jgi:hypothetical protein
MITNHRPPQPLSWSLILGLTIGTVPIAVWLWNLHHPNPCAAAPETCRPAWREVQS